jgi:hypothetical protein
MKIINTYTHPNNPRFMISFTFRAPIAEVETVSGTALACIKHQQQLTKEGAGIYYHGGGVWEVAGYAYDMSDTLKAYHRAYDACTVYSPSLIDGTPLIISL